MGRLPDLSRTSLNKASVAAFRYCWSLSFGFNNIDLLENIVILFKSLANMEHEADDLEISFTIIVMELYEVPWINRSCFYYILYKHFLVIFQKLIRALTVVAFYPALGIIFTRQPKTK